jgi:hypothetical protein
MAVRFGALLPRLVVVSAVWVLASGTLTFAADHQLYAHVSAKTPAPTPTPALVVPDVTDQAFVFAKGILEDGGFAWHVAGPVQGYSTNLVVSQQPLAGTHVEDTGAPTIVLRLAKGRYPQSGDPEDNAPYEGTATRLAVAVNAPTKTATARVAHHKRVVHAAKKHARRTVVHHHRHHKAAVRRARPAAFQVPGAPKEPLDEISLPARAQRLSAWLTPSRRPTAANERHWLYQHAWIVTGAKFGWWRGAAALRVLIGVDRRAESQWGVGYRSEAVARSALAAVEARAK